jgi:hypothetical protein
MRAEPATPAPPSVKIATWYVPARVGVNVNVVLAEDAAAGPATLPADEKTYVATFVPVGFEPAESLSTFDVPTILRLFVMSWLPTGDAVAAKTVLLLIEFAPEGAATNTAATAIVSVVLVDGKDVGTTIATGWLVVPPNTTGVPNVPAEPDALAGATDVNTPKPKAATATSAMRLKVVFVDICFLSISRSREFPPVGFG